MIADPVRIICPTKVAHIPMHTLLSISRLFCLFSFLGLSSLATAQVPIPSAPNIDARGFLLVDFESGQTLAEKNADEQLEPASLTKIMTVYIAFRELAAGNIAPDELVTISKKAWRMAGSRMFIEVGKKISVQDLLTGIIVQSGNDASVALSEHIAGSEETFAQLMNTHAIRLGMTSSSFANSTGLPDDQHFTTARDMAILSAAMIHEFPVYYEMFAQKKFTFNDITQHNRNKLLWRDSSVDGIKTGHTEAAGYCLVASAKRESMRLISVIMGTDSEDARAKASLSLLNYGFRFFAPHPLSAAAETLTDTRVWKGSQEQLALGLREDMYITIPRNRYDQLKASMNIRNRIMAPINKGQEIGSVEIKLDGESVFHAPLIALHDVADGTLWQRLKDEARLLIE